MSEDVREDELYAYVDGTLPAARRIEVESWLAAHPADVARVEAWTAQNRMLHGAFDPVLNEPLPLHLVRTARRAALPLPFKAIAATLAMVASGLVGYAIGACSPDRPPCSRCRHRPRRVQPGSAPPGRSRRRACRASGGMTVQARRYAT